MLTIGKLGQGQEKYYLDKVASGVEDYYTGAGETQGQWLGRGAARLELTGDVEDGVLRAVLAGEHPTTGEQLAGRAGHTRVPGWDLTFSAPKSVSVLYGLGEPDIAQATVAAHHAAVAAGIDYLERHATASRRRHEGRVEQIRGEGLVIAAFRHRTSRAGDPQLHTHCLAVNVVERVDQGWGALHSPVIYRHARTAGFIYQAVLRAELTQHLGVSWGLVHNGYAEIDGVDERLLTCFSKRRAEIEAAMAARGEDSARAAQIAAVRTRQTKEYGVDPVELQERWRAEAEALGIDPTAITSALDRDGVKVADTHLDTAIEEMLSECGLTQQQASFDRRDVMRAWCQQLPAGAAVNLEALEELTSLVTENADVVPVIDGSAALRGPDTLIAADGRPTSPRLVERRWSTVDMLTVERQLLDRAAASARTGAGRVPDEIIKEALDGRDALTDEQTAMVRRVLSSGDGVELVVGRAGSGKTYALAAAADAWRAAGYHPIGAAAAARAAAELENGAGIPSSTVAQLLLDCASAGPHPVLNQRNVVVVDEAGMIDTRRLARLARHVEDAGAKLVLVGDHHQLPAVEAGGAFAGLIERLGASELCENKRQREVWERHTLARLRLGYGGEVATHDVVETYDQHGRLHFGATPASVRAEMVADWYEARRNGDEVAMVALRRADVAELNCRARALLVAEGSVVHGGITVGHRTFGLGDRVVCLNNDRRVGVFNSLFATVVGTNVETGEVAIQPEGTDERIVLPAEYLSDGHLDHGYATTIHKAQGLTCDRALVLGDDRLYRQGAYTALSRGRDRNDLYIVVEDDRDAVAELEDHGTAVVDDPVARLVRALRRDGAKTLATDEADTGASERFGSLADLWRDRDRAAAPLLAEAPADVSATLAAVASAAERARLNLEQVRLVASSVEEQADAKGWRRSARRSAHDSVRLAEREERLGTRWQELEAQRVALADTDSERAEWIDSHRSELEKLASLDKALRRRATLAARAAEIDRPEHLTAALGEPPTSTVGRERWRSAAAAIEMYRARWDGELGDEPSAISVEQAADLVAVEYAIHALGRDDAGLPEPDLQLG